MLIERWQGVVAAPPSLRFMVAFLIPQSRLAVAEWLGHGVVMEHAWLLEQPVAVQSCVRSGRPWEDGGLRRDDSVTFS
jgi:hypothetical protein